ncbi:MAG: hypothetical protein QM813_19305 [Verrucomicrobiota bacterium]
MSESVEPPFELPEAKEVVVPPRAKAVPRPKAGFGLLVLPPEVENVLALKSQSEMVWA